MSCTTRKSTCDSDFATSFALPSLVIVSSPLMYSDRSVPFWIASIISWLSLPLVTGRLTFQAASNLSRTASSSTNWYPGKMFGIDPKSASALHVVVATQRVRPGAAPSIVAGRQQQVADRGRRV